MSTVCYCSLLLEGTEKNFSEIIFSSSNTRLLHHVVVLSGCLRLRSTHVARQGRNYDIIQFMASTQRWTQQRFLKLSQPGESLFLNASFVKHKVKWQNCFNHLQRDLPCINESENKSTGMLQLRIKDARVCRAHLISGNSSQHPLSAFSVRSERKALDANETYDTYDAKNVSCGEHR